MSHFRDFGCLAWEKISSRGCKAPPRRPCTFIRYEDSVKAYMLMNLETHEIFVEKDVNFEESSPRLSSNPLYTSYIVETNSDTSDSDSTCGILSTISMRGHSINTFHMHILPQ